MDAITLMDYFGILPTRAEAVALARTTVLPELFPMEVTLLASPCYAEDGTVARRGEDRSEMFQLREYRAGDDIRQIHWKLSAKTDELILREASQPESRELLLFWDKHHRHTSADGRTGGGCLFRGLRTGARRRVLFALLDRAG